eukprot:COSAG01_NODE_14029_length_1505_cov_1.337127_1_plen_61_part_10
MERGRPGLDLITPITALYAMPDTSVAPMDLRIRPGRRLEWRVACVPGLMASTCGQYAGIES